MKISLIEIDPATNPAIREFLDCFVVDPVIRLDMEAFFAHGARVDPYASAEQLASLRRFTEVYNDLKHQSARALIRHGANSAILQILQAYHEIKEQL